MPQTSSSGMSQRHAATGVPLLDGDMHDGRAAAVVISVGYVWLERLVCVYIKAKRFFLRHVRLQLGRRRHSAG